jgi:hypothetical protein
MIALLCDAAGVALGEGLVVGDDLVVDEVAVEACVVDDAESVELAVKVIEAGAATLGMPPRQVD